MEPPDPERVSSAADFLAFINDLKAHLDAHHHDEHEWQNYDIGSYLDAIAAWSEAAPALSEMQQEKATHVEGDHPTWRGVALLFEIGRIYERCVARPHSEHSAAHSRRRPVCAATWTPRPPQASTTGRVELPQASTSGASDVLLQAGHVQKLIAAGGVYKADGNLTVAAMRALDAQHGAWSQARRAVSPVQILFGQESEVYAHTAGVFRSHVRLQERSGGSSSGGDEPWRRRRQDSDREPLVSRGGRRVRQVRRRRESAHPRCVAPDQRLPKRLRATACRFPNPRAAHVWPITTRTRRGSTSRELPPFLISGKPGNAVGSLASLGTPRRHCVDAIASSESDTCGDSSKATSLYRSARSAIVSSCTRVARSFRPATAPSRSCASATPTRRPSRTKRPCQRAAATSKRCGSFSARSSRNSSASARVAGRARVRRLRRTRAARARSRAGTARAACRRSPPNGCSHTFRVTLWAPPSG